jgi:hypothetical protein
MPTGHRAGGHRPASFAGHLPRCVAPVARNDGSSSAQTPQPLLRPPLVRPPLVRPPLVRPPLLRSSLLRSSLLRPPLFGSHSRCSDPSAVVQTFQPLFATVRILWPSFGLPLFRSWSCRPPRRGNCGHPTLRIADSSSGNPPTRSMQATRRRTRAPATLIALGQKNPLVWPEAKHGLDVRTQPRIVVDLVTGRLG